MDLIMKKTFDWKYDELTPCASFSRQYFFKLQDGMA
jgi:hypothetical protein